MHLRVAPGQRSATATSLLGLRGGDPRSHDSAPDLLAVAVDVEAGSEVVVAATTGDDRERRLVFPSQLGALRLTLGRLEVAYRTIDDGGNQAITAQSTDSRLNSHSLITRSGISTQLSTATTDRMFLVKVLTPLLFLASF
jgi:hypothetical protein